MNKLISTFKRLINPAKTDQGYIEITEKPVQTAAQPSEDEPKSLHQGKRRIKESYTSHWDMDYLPREEVEKIMAASKNKKS